MKSYYLLLATFSFLSISLGQVYNVKSGNWSDAGTWSNGKIPTDTSNIILNYDVTIDQNAYCNSFKTNGHKTVVVSGNTLLLGPQSIIASPSVGTYPACDLQNYFSNTCGFRSAITGRIVNINTANKTITFEVKKCDGTNFNSSYSLFIYPTTTCNDVWYGSITTTVNASTISITIKDNNMTGVKKYTGSLSDLNTIYSYTTPPFTISY